MALLRTLKKLRNLFRQSLRVKTTVLAMYVRYYLKKALFVIPSIILLVYVFWPSVMSLTSVAHFYFVEKQALAEVESADELSRRVQKFFLRYRMNVALSDIFIHWQNKVPYKVTGCLRHPVVVYVPIMVRYPYFGSTTYEMCVVVKEQH